MTETILLSITVFIGTNIDLAKYKTAVVPVVYIALGVYILWKNL